MLTFYHTALDIATYNMAGTYWLVDSQEAKDITDNKWYDFKIKIPSVIQNMLSLTDMQVALSQCFIFGVKSPLLLNIYMDICELQSVNKMQKPLLSQLMTEENGLVNIQNLKYVNVLPTHSDYVRIYITCDNTKHVISPTELGQIRTLFLLHFTKQK